MVRLNSSVGLGAPRKNARVARCCRGVWGSTPRKILGLLAFYIARSATVATVLTIARAMRQERPASKPLALRGAQHRFGLTKRSFGKFEVLGMMGLIRKTRK